jgi:hypothetical protein
MPQEFRVMEYRLTGCDVGVPEQRECQRSKIKEIRIDNLSGLKTVLKCILSAEQVK